MVECGRCGKQVAKKSEKYHQEFHQQKAVITVPDWIQGAEVQENGTWVLKISRAAVEEEGEEGEFICPVCLKGYARSSTLRSHIWKSHPSPLVPVNPAPNANGGALPGLAAAALPAVAENPLE